MADFDSLDHAIAAAPTLEAALEALLDGLAQRVKATSNDQNVQKLSREMRIATPRLIAAFAGRKAAA